MRGKYLVSEKKEAMLLSIGTFSRLPRILLYFLSSPCRETDDICLISCEEVNKLNHVVMASDGKYYNCMSLHEWIHYGKNYVIPGVSLTHVTLNPYVLYCLTETLTVTCFALQRSKTLWHALRSPLRKGTKPPRIHALVRIHRYISDSSRNKIKKNNRPKIKQTGRFTHSHTGPFKCLS